MTRTSTRTSSTSEGPADPSAGFSLIEILVVVALIALITFMAIPGISSYLRVSINSATREVASTIKEAYNSAMITGKVHRLVYDLKENSYWVESGPVDALLDTKASAEREERRKRYAKSSEKEAKSPFSLEKSVTRKKIALPRGVTFEDIVTQQSENPLTEGVAYTHIFPHGITEQTLIHLQDDSQHHASLVISPLVGQTDLIDRYVNRKEAFGE